MSIETQNIKNKPERAYLCNMSITKICLINVNWIYHRKQTNKFLKNELSLQFCFED